MIYLDEAFWAQERARIHRVVFASGIPSRFELVAQIDRHLSTIPL